MFTSCDNINSLYELLDFNFKFSLISFSIFFESKPSKTILSTVIETKLFSNTTDTLLKKLVSNKFLIILFTVELVISLPTSISENIKIISSEILSFPSILICSITSLFETDK